MNDLRLPLAVTGRLDADAQERFRSLMEDQDYFGAEALLRSRGTAGDEAHEVVLYCTNAEG